MNLSKNDKNILTFNLSGSNIQLKRGKFWKLFGKEIRYEKGKFS